MWKQQWSVNPYAAGGLFYQYKMMQNDLLIIPMTLFNDIMPYFDEFIHVYG